MRFAKEGSLSAAHNPEAYACAARQGYARARRLEQQAIKGLGEPGGYNRCGSVFDE